MIELIKMVEKHNNLTTINDDRNNFGPPWKESRGNLRGGGYWERAPCIRSQREVVLQNRNSEFWDEDGRCPVGRMTSCGRWGFWYGESWRSGGRTNLCGSYGGE